MTPSLPMPYIFVNGIIATHPLSRCFWGDRVELVHPICARGWRFRLPEGLQAQQPFRVAMQYLGLVVLVQHQAFHPCRPRLVGDEGIVNREQDAVRPHFLEAAKQRRIGKKPLVVT